MVKSKIFFYVIFFLLLGNIFSLKAQTVDTFKLNRSIAQGVNYLNERIASDSVYYLVTPLLIPIGKYYHLSIHPGIYDIQPRITEEKERDIYEWYRGMFNYQQRETYISNHKDDLSSIDFINLFPLFGDHVCSREVFLRHMDSALTTKSYELTHAYLATLILQKTQMIEDTKILQWQRKASDRMKKLLPKNGSNPFSDLQIEVIALSLYGGIKINEKLIVQLLESQNPNGSWAEHGNSSSWRRDHTTVLALWALLEWKFKDDQLLYLPYNSSY